MNSSNTRILPEDRVSYYQKVHCVYPGTTRAIALEVATIYHQKLLELERLCDATYVAQGADAYNHACAEMERWQAKRESEGKDPGTTNSLCDGIAWLYQELDRLEAKLPHPTSDLQEGAGSKMDAPHRVPGFSTCENAPLVRLYLACLEPSYEPVSSTPTPTRRALREFYALCRDVQTAVTPEEQLPDLAQPTEVMLRVQLPDLNRKADQAVKVFIEFNFSRSTFMFGFPLEVFNSECPKEMFAYHYHRGELNRVAELLTEATAKMDATREAHAQAQYRFQKAVEACTQNGYHTSSHKL